MQLAAQVTRLSNLEQAGRESDAAAAAASMREQELETRMSQLMDQLSSAADSAARQVAEAVAAALEGASQQVSDAEVSKNIAAALYGHSVSHRKAGRPFDACFAAGWLWQLPLHNVSVYDNGAHGCVSACRRSGRPQQRTLRNGSWELLSAWKMTYRSVARDACLTAASARQALLKICMRMT